VNLTKTGDIAFDTAAMRLKVSTGAAQATSNCNVLELRHTIAHNVAQWCTLQCSAAPAEHTIGTGEGLVAYFKMEGTGNITPAGSNAVAVMEVINEHAGTGVSDVLIARQNATGQTVVNIAKVECVAGTATNGVLITNSGTMTSAIKITGAITNAFNFTSVSGAVATQAGGTLTITKKIKIIDDAGATIYIAAGTIA